MQKISITKYFTVKMKFRASQSQSEKNTVFQDFIWDFKNGHFLDIYKCPKSVSLFTLGYHFSSLFKKRVNNKNI